MTIKIGERLPNATLRLLTPKGPKPVETKDYFAGKTVVLFGLPGAFTPTCHKNHLPEFIVNEERFKAKGVAESAKVPWRSLRRSVGWPSSRHANVARESISELVSIRSSSSCSADRRCASSRISTTVLPRSADLGGEQVGRLRDRCRPVEPWRGTERGNDLRVDPARPDSRVGQVDDRVAARVQARCRSASGGVLPAPTSPQTTPSDRSATIQLTRATASW